MMVAGDDKEGKFLVNCFLIYTLSYQKAEIMKYTYTLILIYYHCIFSLSFYLETPNYKKFSSLSFPPN